MSQIKIDRITPEQAARFAEWAEKWIAIGLSTEPADFEAATEAALRAYALCNLEKPKIVLRMSSPYGATLGGAIAWAILCELKTSGLSDKVRSQVESQVGSQVWSQVESQVGSQVWSQVWSQVRSQVESQVRSQVRSQVESQVWSQVWSQVRSQVWSQVRSQVWSQVESQVWSQVWSQVRSQVWSQVWSQVESQVWSQVRSQVESQVRSQVESQVWSQVESQVRSQVESQVESQLSDATYNDRGGSLWASWGAYISFVRDVLGWRGSTLDRFEVDETLIKSCGWVWWHEDVLAISDRPTTVRRDDIGRLHCEDEPAISYRDGWSLWSWHGVTVPQHVIERPDSITVKTINAEENAEVRRVMIERFGYERYVSGSPVIHEDATGKLRKRRNKRGDEIAVVEVINGSKEPDGTHKSYWLSVPPECRTATEAVAWTYGMSESEYAGLVRRT